MLPVQDVLPSRTTPRVTLALVAGIISVLAAEYLLDARAVRAMILSYGLVPAHMSWPTLATSAFLHHGLVDAFANAGALWIFGDNVEDRLGRLRFVLLWLVGAAASGLLVTWLDPDNVRPVIGAGGAVGAVAGAHLILFRPARILLLVPARQIIDLVEVPAALVVLSWVVVVGLAGPPIVGSVGSVPLGAVSPAIGLVVGVLTGRLLARPERLSCAWWNVPGRQLPERRRTSRDTSASSVSSASN